MFDNNTKRLTSNFLSKLSVLDYELKQKESYQEDFNIFNVLHHYHDERRLHSRFISALLSNERKQEPKRIFLEYFLEQIGVDDFANYENIKVFPNTGNKSEYRDIDILIIDRKSNKAVVIENKIYAGDSNNEKEGQLIRYYNYIKDEGIPVNNIKVFYLSIDGHDPLDDSLKDANGNSIRCETINYEKHIIGWLKLCLKECVNEPYLRESILQYINLINDMTNNIDLQDRLKIRDLIAESDENMDSTKLLVENFKHVKWHTVKDFWDELADKLKINYEVTETPTDDNITDTTHYDYYKKSYESNNDYGIYFYVNRKFKLFVWNSTEEPIYWGVMKNNELNDEILTKNDFQFFNSEYWWKSFNLDDEDQIDPTDFYRQGTFNIIKEKNRKEIINQMVDEINEYIDRLGL